MVDLPAARSLDRLGVTTCPPVAFIGVARRCCFNPRVVKISYIDTGLGDDFLASWKSRSESVKIVEFPQPDEAPRKVPDAAEELPTSSSKEHDFPVSRRTVTHLAHAIARLRAGLMRFHVLACGTHSMMDGSYAVLNAQGMADEAITNILPQVDDNFFPFVVDYDSDQIFVFSIHNLVKLWRTDFEVDSDEDFGLSSYLLCSDVSLHVSDFCYTYVMSEFIEVASNRAYLQRYAPYSTYMMNASDELRFCAWLKADVAVNQAMAVQKVRKWDIPLRPKIEMPLKSLNKNLCGLKCHSGETSCPIAAGEVLDPNAVPIVDTGATCDVGSF